MSKVILIITFCIPYVTGLSFAYSEEINSTKIRMICKDRVNLNYAFVIESDNPLLFKNAEKYFDKNYPWNNPEIDGKIYFFEEFHLPEMLHPDYLNKVNKLLTKIQKNQYTTAYSGKIMTGGYKFRFYNDRLHTISFWFSTKKNTENFGRLSIFPKQSENVNDELQLFAGGYTCHHEIFEAYSEVGNRESIRTYLTENSDLPHETIE